MKSSHRPVRHRHPTKRAAVGARVDNSKAIARNSVPSLGRTREKRHLLARQVGGKMTT